MHKPLACDHPVSLVAVGCLCFN